MNYGKQSNIQQKRIGRLDGIFEAVVKEDQDFQSMGRISVWFPEMGTREDDENSWIIVSYASPYAGSTPIRFVDRENTQTFEGTQTSYGIWMGSPEVDNTVYVFFVNGEASRGFWFACSYGQFTNNMMPNIPVGETYQYSGEKVPVAEFNKFDQQPNKQSQPKPFHKTHYEGIRNQGLKNDTVRGFSQHGARSEPSTKVYGILTKKGHYISLEDTDEDSKIRLRTVNGGQFLIDDTRSSIYIINTNGSGWVEINEEGKIMVYGDSDISMRTKGDFNVYSDQNINMECLGNFNLKATGNFNTESLNLTSLVNEKYVLNTKSEVVINSNDKVSIVSGDTIGIVAGAKLQMSSSNAVDISSGADMKVTSGANMHLGACLNLNMGSSAITNVSGGAMVNVQASGPVSLVGAAIMASTGGSAPAPTTAGSVSATKISLEPLPIVTKTDILQPESDDAPQENDVETIVSTFPTHEPCPEHTIK